MVAAFQELMLTLSAEFTPDSVGRHLEKSGK